MRVWRRVKETCKQNGRRNQDVLIITNPITKMLLYTESSLSTKRKHFSFSLPTRWQTAEATHSGERKNLLKLLCVFFFVRSSIFYRNYARALFLFVYDKKQSSWALFAGWERKIIWCLFENYWCECGLWIWINRAKWKPFKQQVSQPWYAKFFPVYCWRAVTIAWLKWLFFSIFCHLRCTWLNLKICLSHRK